MQRKYLKKESILTIPNLLSLIRILLIPFIIWLYCAQKAYLCTIIVIALSGFTDIIDGKIARKFNMVSDVGKVLDPVADKLTQATLVICLTARYPWMWALLALFAVKECLMLLWGYLTLKITDTIHIRQTQYSRALCRYDDPDPFCGYSGSGSRGTHAVVRWDDASVSCNVW